MEDCIFCKIIRGEIPCRKIFEDENVFAFLDIAKDFDGHILVIPKKHCKNILDCGAEELNLLMQGVQKVCSHLVNNCGYSGVNLVNCSGESAGQTVNHFHIHIFPRSEDDGEKVFPTLGGAKLSLEEMCEKLKIN